MLAQPSTGTKGGSYMTRRFVRFLRRNTIALLALFLALGGTTYAASTALIGKNTVASPQVVNGSLKTIDLSKKARRALKGNRGPRGFAGAQGAKGATGSNGATGPKGATGSSAPAGGVTSVAINGGSAITTTGPGEALITKTINAPGPGQVIALATGTVYVSASAGTAYLVRFKLNAGTTPNTTEDGYVAFVRDTNPTTGIRMHPFSASRVFAVGAAGPFTVNLSAWQQSGTGAQSDDTVVTLLWVPADLS
jgi:hypothetical protein